MALECSGVNQHTSTFWSVTLQPVGADQATIWQMKGDIPSFHMRHRRLICTKRLQSYGGCINLNNFPLVCHACYTLALVVVTNGSSCRLSPSQIAFAMRATAAAGNTT